MEDLVFLVNSHAKNLLKIDEKPFGGKSVKAQVQAQVALTSPNMGFEQITSFTFQAKLYLHSLKQLPM